jgi:hypothetical protein
VLLERAPGFRERHAPADDGADALLRQEPEQVRVHILADGA